MKIEDEISQKKKFKNEWHRAVVNILFTSGWLQLRMKEYMKTYGITVQQFNVLRILKGQYPNPISTNLIRERMLDKMSDVSRIISRLQEKKLVAVKKASHDKRLVDIVISIKGLDLLKTIDSEDHHLDVIMNTLTEEEAAQLSNLLDKARG